MEIPSAEQSVNRMVSTMHNIAMQNQPVGVGIGQVLNPPPEIQIAYENIILEAKDLYLDQFLLIKYKRMLKGEIEIPEAEGHIEIDEAEGDIRTNTQSKKGGAGKPRFISHTHKINNSYKASIEGDYKASLKGEYTASAITTDFGLAKGDLVSLLPVLGGQKFIVLGKIIYAPDFDYSDEEEGSGSSDSNPFI